MVECAGGRERLLLKASYHPYWRASVDGRVRPTVHVAPNLMAVDVPAGRHTVVLSYRNPIYSQALFLPSMAGLIACLLAGARRERVGGTARPGYRGATKLNASGVGSTPGAG